MRAGSEPEEAPSGDLVGDRADVAAGLRDAGQQRGDTAHRHYERVSDLMEMYGHSEDRRDDLVEQVAREIQLRGLSAPAVLFLQASRPYRPLGSSAMVFFDPVLRGVFGGDVPVATELMADDLGIERLIERLQDPDEEIAWDA